MHPRSISRRQITSRRRLTGAAAVAARSLSLPGLAGLLRVSNAAIEVVRIEPAPERLPTDVVAFALGTDRADPGSRAALAVPSSLARGLIDSALARSPGADPGALTSGEEGALLYVLDRAGGDWIDAAGSGFEVRGVLADAEQAADYLGRAPRWQVVGRFTAGSLNGAVWLWTVDPARADSSVRLALRSPPAELHVTWRLQVGAALVSAGEIEGLAVGDVVELDGVCHPLARTGGARPRLVSGGVSRAARWLDHRRLELVSTDERRSAMVSRSEESTSVTAILEDALEPELGAMEVGIQVEVGRVALSLEQARSLLAGAILELDRDVGPEVQLRVRDRLIARGELVDCEGRLAVQITEVP